MAVRVGFVSFRFGSTDGVSVVASHWMRILRGLGYEVTTIAGSGNAERLIAGLGIDEATSNSEGTAGLERELRSALSDVDIAIVENLLTIPLNLPASHAVAEVLRGRPAILHHHDPPWHRKRFAHVEELPVDDDAWLHVSINQKLQSELAERGIESTLIYNGFDTGTVVDGNQRCNLRKETRAAIDVEPDELLVAHPVRAIERKNIPAAIELAATLGATYWLLGPAEEGYGPELARLIDSADCRVIHQPHDDLDAIYAAADHVTFPSTWEGFGNPPIEAALRRRTVSVGCYPVADELRDLGFDWFDPHDAKGIAAALADPESGEVRAMLDTNEQVARRHFTTTQTRAALRQLLESAGWLP